MGESSRVLAAGRASEIVALDAERVLRRMRQPADLSAREAAVMRYARAQAFPVPQVFEVRAEGLVMEWVRGPTMGADLASHPWRAGAHAKTLADLHRRLHAIAPPPGAPARYGDPREGDVLLHGDLHPLNVMLSPQGPVVVDWTNAGRGPAGLDVADTWLVLAAAEIPGDRWTRLAVGAVRRRLIRRFLAAAGREEAAACLERVAGRRAQDPHLSPEERAAMRDLAARE
ncbi:MAG: phosphotransferase, partial [Candidatus Dormibacteraceae bacterium]